MSEDDKKLSIPTNPVAEYKKGIAERAARMREERRAQSSMPDLSQADASYDPRKSGPMTLSQIGESQKKIAGGDKPDGQRGLSPDTIAGLQALKTEMDKKRAEMPPKEEPMAEPAPQQTDPPKEQKEAQEQQIRAALRDVDDLEFERIAARMREDVINNSREKSAVEERLKKEGNEISLEDGLGTGVFQQMVPVTDKLRVLYRSVSPYENRALRLLLWKWVDAEPRLEGLAGDLFGMMLIVAAVVQIGGNRLPEHMKGQDFYHATFDEETFTQKFELLSRYPGPLIHAIGVHANWFDERVRKVLTSESLKNG